MSCRLQRDGMKFLLGMLAGSGKKINGMYIEYGPRGAVVEAERDRTFFDGIKSDRRSGYVRVPVSFAEVRDGAAMFTAVLYPGTINKGNVNKGTVIKRVTLVNFKDENPANDTFVYSADVPDSLVVPGASITVTAGMKLNGD